MGHPHKTAKLAHYPTGHPTPDEDRIYDEDEREFMLAMDRYKRVNRRPFPTWCEVLGVLKSLGYHK